MLSNVASSRHMITLTFFYLSLSTVISTTNAKNEIPISEAILKYTRENCDDTSINFFQAKHFEKCKKLYEPTTQFNFTVEDSDLFFCLALWDRTWKICSEFSDKLHYLSSQTILKDAAIFDAEIDRMIESDTPENTLDICTNFGAPSDRKFYGRTEKFVSQLMDAGNCISSCHYSEPSGLNPLCLSIFRVDKEIEKFKTALLHPEQTLFTAVDVTSSPNSQDSREDHGSDEGSASLESRVPHYPYFYVNGISSTGNEDTESDESDENYKNYVNGGNDADEGNNYLDVDIFERGTYKRVKVNNDSSLIFVLGLAVIGLVCVGYLSCSYKRRVSAQQQQAYRGLDPSLEYDEYFNHDVNKYEKFHQPTALPVPK